MTGDLIPRKGHISRWDLPTGCLPDLLESIEYLLKMEIKQLVPGHGETIVGDAAVLAELEQHQQVLSQIVENKGLRPQEWPRPAPTCNWFTPEPPLAE
jgi:glyoxylase-like metal-dependent hydrolase (beta-lactamase superfamily II)